MARRPEPWYWAKRKGWYVQINNKQILLGKTDKRTAKPPPEVLQEWHRLMSVGGRLTDEERRRTTVPELIEVFLEWKTRTRRASSVLRYNYILSPFAKRYENRRSSEIQPEDVIDFAESSEWGESTKAVFVGMVKTCWKYAREKGYFDQNPLASLDNPYRMQVREHAMTETEYQYVRNLRADSAWRLLVDLLWHTGARPGEISKIEARHLDPTEPKATLSSKEHKTGRQSGRSRVIFFPDDLMATLRSLAEETPEGPIVLNSIGKPWRAITIASQMLRWRRQGKIREGLVLYSARHGFVTRKIAEGHSPSLVSKAVGHANTRVTEGVYFNPVAALVGQVAKNGIRAAVEAEALKAQSGGTIDVDALVKAITDGVLAKIVVSPPHSSDA